MPEQPIKDRRAPILHHLTELRCRITWSVLVIVIFSGLAFAFHQQILTLLMEPAEGFAGIPNQKPIYTDITEFLGIAVKVSLLTGLLAALPFVLFQIVMFIAPGLTPGERRYLYLLMPASLLSFVAGAAFGYAILFPPAVRFLLSFGSDVATPFIRIGSYTSLMLSLLFWMGIVFETPVVLFFLSRIGVVTPELLTRSRRYAVVASFILGAIITPTFDPINQTMVAVPIIVLYEVGIVLARIGRRGRRVAAAKLELDTDGH